MSTDLSHNDERIKREKSKTKLFIVVPFIAATTTFVLLETDMDAAAGTIGMVM
jgi:hypothetical protein